MIAVLLLRQAVDAILCRAASWTGSVLDSSPDARVLRKTLLWSVAVNLYLLRCTRTSITCIHAQWMIPGMEP